MTTTMIIITITRDTQLHVQYAYGLASASLHKSMKTMYIHTNNS